METATSDGIPSTQGPVWSCPPGPCHLGSPRRADPRQLHGVEEDILIHLIYILKFGLTVRKLVFLLWWCLCSLCDMRELFHLPGPPFLYL